MVTLTFASPSPAQHEPFENVINYKAKEKYEMVRGSRWCIQFYFYTAEEEKHKENAYHCDYLNLLWKWYLSSRAEWGWVEKGINKNVFLLPKW